MTGFFPGCKTTAMAIMPHTDVKKALELAMGMDIPFWPQLPKIGFGEDMYAQTSHNFPGISIDYAGERVDFISGKFEEDLAEYSQKMAYSETFAMNHDHSVVYGEFLNKKLGDYTAIRGQMTGPVSFGFRVVDENSRPIIYRDDIRNLLFDFIQRKVNTQYRQLRDKNPHAFVWLDEPGLGWVFSGLSGYNDIQARQEYRDFVSGIDGPKALHLCANVNLPYLLDLGIDILSFDAFQMEAMPRGYAENVARFIERDGVIAWGIVPTDSGTLDGETPGSLAALLLSYWDIISTNSGMSSAELARHALVTPARCCLKNIGNVGASNDCDIKSAPGVTMEEWVVEKAFEYVKTISNILKERFSF